MTTTKLWPVNPLALLLLVSAFLVGIVGVLYLSSQERRTMVMVAVPTAVLPPYHQIQPRDLTQRAYRPGDVASSVLREPTQLVGRYTLDERPAQKPLNSDRLGPSVAPTHFSQSVAVGVPATAAMVIGGTVRPGDLVDILLVQQAEPPSPPVATVFENILVLDVVLGPSSARPQGGNVPLTPPGRSSGADTADFVVVLALPAGRQPEFAIRSAGASVLITRRI